MKIVKVSEYRLQLTFDEIADYDGLKKYCDLESFEFNDSGNCLTIEAFDSEEAAISFHDAINRFLK